MPIADFDWEPVISDLKKAARKTLARYPGPKPSATSLVHDAWLELARSEKWDAESERHLVALTSRVMRNNMVDAARKMAAARHGAGAAHVELDPSLYRASAETPETIVMLDEALDKLHTDDERAAGIFEHYYFGGCTQKEIADLFTVSESTVRDDLRLAKAMLSRTLSGGT